VDLTSVLLRLGAGRPHVLVVPVVGSAGVRLAVEAELARRGWPAAATPANADLLVLAGSAGAALGPVVDRIWRQVPAPRARVEVLAAEHAAEALDGGQALLGDLDHQRRAGGGHDTAPDPGLPMADLGEDRDGLTLDRLHVALGPVLPDWPAGLVLRVVLQGDVIQEAEVEVLDAGRGAPFWEGHDRAAARELDGLARFLGVAGWPEAADQGRRLRDELLAGAHAGRVAERAEALVRRVRRSRALRWLVRGITAGPTDLAAVLEQRLEAVRAALATPLGSVVPRPPAAALPAALNGAELAAARLVVAALDPDTEPVPAAPEVPRG
jgi:hypothetical protein